MALVPFLNPRTAGRNQASKKPKSKKNAQSSPDHGAGDGQIGLGDQHDAIAVIEVDYGECRSIGLVDGVEENDDVDEDGEPLFNRKCDSTRNGSGYIGCGLDECQGEYFGAYLSDARSPENTFDGTHNAEYRVAITEMVESAYRYGYRHVRVIFQDITYEARLSSETELPREIEEDIREWEQANAELDAELAAIDAEFEAESGTSR